MDNAFYAIGFMVGLLFAIVICIIVRKGRKKQYDERQILARGNAYKVSFIVAMLYMIFCLLAELFDLKWALLTMQMLIGILFSCAVFIIMCIFTNAYFGVNQKNSIAYIVILAIIGLMNVGVGIRNLCMGESPFTNGALNGGSMNLLVATFLFIIDIALIIKAILEKRAGAEK